MARRAVQEELTKEKIMQTAAELFEEHGYREVSMRKIAQQLGYSHGAIYYHFKDKAELFSAMIAHNFEELTAVIDSAISANPEAGRTRLQELFISYIQYGFSHKREYELMFLIDDPDLQTYSEEGRSANYDSFAAAVLQVLGLSGIRNPGYVMIPRSLLLSLHGFVSYYLHKDETFGEVEPLAKAYVRMLEAGLISMF